MLVGSVVVSTGGIALSFLQDCITRVVISTNNAITNAFTDDLMVIFIRL
jgi:hypothetical protein